MQDRALLPRDREALERELGATLPGDFVWFLSEYGGGEFAFAEVFSADEGSDLYILHHQIDEIAGTAVAFSEDGTGNLFCFPVDGGRGEDRVVIWDHESDEIQEFGDAGVLDFIRRLALNELYPA